MDRAFLEYYEEELAHIRGLATEFAALHPGVAANLALDTVPCPDPYVERLLEGVAFLAARTRLKLDAEGGRFARAVLDALYPDLAAPTPAVGMVALRPGGQVATMRGGHVVARGTRLVAGLRPGLSTRAVYTTAQDVTLWPLEISAVAYHQDRAALAAARIGDAGAGRAEAALRVTLRRAGGPLADLALDRIDLHLRDRAKAPTLFDTLFGAALGAAARPGRPPGQPPEALAEIAGPLMVGLRDAEALMPRTRAGFEGYRLLREYFMMPERFHFVRIEGLRPVVARAGAELDIVFPLARPAPDLTDLKPADLGLFATPVINLFERDCDMLEVDPRRPRHVLHADRTRPRDFEIYRLVSLEDADRDGPEAAIPPLFGFEPGSGGTLWWAERRPRRPGEDERRRGQFRTSYAGDDLFLSLSRPPGAPGKPVTRLDPRALCTNRDLALLDDQPSLTLESGDPVQAVTLLGALRPPRPALRAGPETRAGERRADEIAWRLVSQLSLNYLGLAVEGQALEPLAATLALYADRGDPGLARHAGGITAVAARPVIERLPIAGPMCFGRGTEITLTIDETRFAGQAALLLPALLARLFARYAAVNAFTRTRTRFARGGEEVSWPIAAGNRGLV